MLVQGGEPFDPIVEVLMTPRPITVKPFETVGAAATIMRTCRIRHLPVVGANAQLAGVLSLRDVIAADERALVGAVMSTPPDHIQPSASVTRACERMLATRRSCLPVVDGAALVGIFTASDALRFAQVALEADARETRRRVPVTQLMTMRPLTTVVPATTLADAWQKMRLHRVRHLPVLADGRIVGMLSDRDVLAAGSAWLKDTGGAAAMVVADAMSTRLSTIRAERSASEAAATLLRRRIGALPVLRSHDELSGILTVADFMYWILARR